MTVRKTTLEIDDEKIARAQEILGTTGLKDTVDEAIARVLRVAAAQRLVEIFDEIDLDPEQLDRWRHE
jgi:Arc/MetJ family transcription regulator